MTGANMAVIRADEAKIQIGGLTKVISFRKAHRIKGVKTFLNPIAISTRKNCPFGSFMSIDFEPIKIMKNIHK